MFDSHVAPIDPVRGRYIDYTSVPTVIQAVLRDTIFCDGFDGHDPSAWPSGP